MILRVVCLATLLAMAGGLAFGQADTSSSAPSSMEPSPPPSVTDADLEKAVRAAYSGASAFAASHGNYFTRDDAFQPLRDAVRSEILQEGYGAVAVGEAPSASIAAAKACLATPGAELRIVTTTFGDGITLV